MTLAVAHRGDPRGAVENTVEAVARAARLGADAIEVDLRLTADGVVVLHHDPRLDRLWDRPEAVADLTFAQLRALVPQVPTLEEALAARDGRGVPLVLDVAEPAVALAALAELGRLGTDAWFCGAPEALAEVRAGSGRATLLLSWNDPVPPGPGTLAAVRPQYLNPEQRFVTASTVRDWHGRGFGVCTWTVDDPVRRAELVRLGVDAIISNDVPGLVRDLAR